MPIFLIKGTREDIFANTYPLFATFYNYWTFAHLCGFLSFLHLKTESLYTNWG